MSTGQLLPNPNVKELRTVDEPSSTMALFERLARDPGASVEKIERLMALWERAEGRKAEAAFNSAMSSAQKDMRPVAADATNPQTRSRYASYEALDRAVRPIYTDHGFGLSFDTGEGAPAEYVRVLCYVTHAGGHARTYHVDMPADGKGAKGGDVMTKTHAAGSAMSYGQRYLLKLIFNIAVGDDDDGNRAGRKEEPPRPPAKFDEWVTDMGAVADQGFASFAQAWKDSKQEFKDYAAKHHAAAFTAMKAKAVKVKPS